ncbi:MAG: radical SAM protein [Actinobacteria bacterium]|nr:radical SAM protein [Actinomycetota bacterium]
MNLPKPEPDKELYKVTLSNRKNFSESFRKNYEVLQEIKSQGNLYSERVETKPVKVDIEVAAQCNLRCPMCDITKQKKAKRSPNMTLTKFMSVVDRLNTILELRIAGLGEPTLNKDIAKMIDYARQQHIWVRMVTNATLLHRSDLYKQILDADICELIVSIDGVDKVTFETLRKGADYELVVKNCKALNLYSQQKGFEKRVKMWTTIQRTNNHQLLRFPMFAKELGFKKLGVSLSLHRWGSKEWQTYLDHNLVQHSEAQLTELLTEAERHSIEIGIEDVSEKYSATSLCPWPFERIHIAADERIVPCCMVSNPDTYNLGKFISLDHDWNSDAYLSLRRGHLLANLPAICTHCYVKDKPVINIAPN